MKKGTGDISRKEALQKTGKYLLFTAASMMTILEPLQGQGIPPKSKPKPPRPSGRQKKAKKTDPPPSF